jgi:tRNA/tmRNA/rRNA uracil-C5-methylase (TrmA/RlmC/RlmD family)
MTLEPGQRLELSIEKPVAGGRMLARHGGQVVLVQGAIPGERVTARIERVERQLAFAETVDVIDASIDRRSGAPAIDLACGGAAYAHVNYPRQVLLKGEVIRDAFARLARLPLADDVAVEPSPEREYRMRARLHVRGARAGFYREGTHELCDARGTGQLRADAVDAVERAVAPLAAHGCQILAAELSENIAADERVLHVTAGPGEPLTDAVLDEATAAGALTGCSGRSADGALRVSGVPVVADPLSALTSGRAASGTLQRHAESFFQANRFLLPRLVTTVIDAAVEGDVLDLYAGVGLFAVSLAAAGRTGITAVEGDRTSGRDLQRNAALNASAIRIAVSSVEAALPKWRGRPAGTVIVDPPRTGISREAMKAILSHGGRRIVYVSCDPPTMARDARRMLDGGYRVASIHGFDLFPNTPHVEAVGVFDREGG